MQIILSKKAAKILESIDKPTRQRIIGGIEKIPQGDTKQMQGQFQDTYRLRIGRYRAIFYHEGDDIIVLQIGSRGDICK